MKVKFKLCVSAISIGLALGSLSTFAAPLPQGPSNVSGATIDTQGNVMNVNQTTQFAKMDWNSFDIAAGNAVNFNQQSDYTAVNRVTGGNASQINGTLTAGGNVILINPNGVNIGGSADIHATGFGAIAASVDDEEFKQWNGTGSLSLKGSADVIIDKGAMINATDVMIGGLNIKNDGNIYATKQAGIIGNGDLKIIQLNNGIAIYSDIYDYDYSGSVINNGDILSQDKLYISATDHILNTGTLSGNDTVNIQNGGGGNSYGVKNEGAISSEGVVYVHGTSDSFHGLYNSGSIYGGNDSQIHGVTGVNDNSAIYGIFNTGDITLMGAYNSVNSGGGFYNNGRVESHVISAITWEKDGYAMHNDTQGVLKAYKISVNAIADGGRSNGLYNAGLIDTSTLDVKTGVKYHNSPITTTGTYGIYNTKTGKIYASNTVVSEFNSATRNTNTYSIYNEGTMIAPVIAGTSYVKYRDRPNVGYGVYNTGVINAGSVYGSKVYNSGVVTADELYTGNIEEGTGSSMNIKVIKPCPNTSCSPTNI